MVYSIVIEVSNVLNLCKLISNITFICYFLTFSELILHLSFHSKTLTSNDQSIYILPIRQYEVLFCHIENGRVRLWGILETNAPSTPVSSQLTRMFLDPELTFRKNLESPHKTAPNDNI